MAFSMFKKRKALKIAEEVYSALVEGLDEMERKGVERIALTVNESKPDKNALGWNPLSGSNYYPHEMLDGEEQRMVGSGRHYEVGALIRDHAGGVSENERRGVELVYRTHVKTLLPIGEEVRNPLNYITKRRVISSEEELEQFADDVAALNWTPEEVRNAVAGGIKEYLLTTERLMDAAGVHSRLEKMNGNYSPFEQIMRDVRSNIESAKYRECA